MPLETDVAKHYTADGSILQRIDAALRAMGLAPEDLTYDLLKTGDAFHTGGFQATKHLLDPLGITADMAVVDLGCGIGGAARHIAKNYGAHVTGIDLTEDFIETGRVLTKRLGMEARVTLLQGSVLDLPLVDASADLAVMLHVGMNIADKDALFAEAARVLKPGGRFALFDVMRGAAEDALIFPLPWSTTAETSHLDPPARYRAAAQAAGLTLEAETDRTAFAREAFARQRARIAAEGPPPFGANPMMGDSAPVKSANYTENLTAGRLAPTEMVFRKSSSTGDPDG